VSDEAIQQRRSVLPEDGTPPAAAPIDKLIHLALPVRLIHMHNGERGAMEFACTYDIHPRGARLRSARDVKVGDLITIERGRSKSLCEVVWTADPDSELRGQFTVECIEGGKTPWEPELGKMEEQYLPVIPSGPNRPGLKAFRRGEQNRRRAPRFAVEGEANLLEFGGRSHGEARLEQISEYGCLINAHDPPAAGTSLRLVLNMCEVSVALRGHVRYASQNRGMGIEFEEIRQGDRPLLDYVLNRLKKPRTEDFADLEVITESLEAVAQ